MLPRLVIILCCLHGLYFSFVQHAVTHGSLHAAAIASTVILTVTVAVTVSDFEKRGKIASGHAITMNIATSDCNGSCLSLEQD